MAQIMRAQAVAAITDDGNFTGSSVYASVGGPSESSPDTGDYWNGNDNQTDVLELRMTDLSGSIPDSGTCTVTIYETTCDTNVAPASGGTQPTFDLEVYEGATQRASVATVNSTDSAFTAYSTLTFTASSITDWSDVRIRFTSNGSGGSGPNRRGVAVSYMEISTPDASLDITVAPAAVALTLTTYKPTVSMDPRVYLNTSESKVGASEMTVTSFTDTTVTFTDPSGSPTGGSLYIGVENPLTGDIGWLSGCTATATGVTVTPPAVALTLATPQPTVTYDVTVSPATKALTLTPIAPTVTVDALLTPATVGLTLAPQTPTVTYDVTVSPAAATLTLTPQTPTVTYDVGITPATVGLTLTANQPTVTVDADVTVTPAAAALTLTPQTPTVTYDVTVAPAAVALTLAPQTPAVTYDVTVAPTTVALTLAPQTPTVTYDVTVAPATVGLTLTANAPTVTVVGAAFQSAWAMHTNKVIQVTGL